MKVKSALKIKKAENNEEPPASCCGVIHGDVVANVMAGLSGDAELRRVAELFKALNDETRLKRINALLLSEMCVCDIAALLNMTQPAVSHHLKTLKQAQLVKYRRIGKEMHYSLDDEHVRNIFYQGMLHACENK
jgi:ArsR family transcriptional regulator